MRFSFGAICNKIQGKDLKTFDFQRELCKIEEVHNFFVIAAALKIRTFDQDNHLRTDFPILEREIMEKYLKLNDKDRKEIIRLIKQINRGDRR